jgi:hypothetical protein
MNNWVSTGITVLTAICSLVAAGVATLVKLDTAKHEVRLSALTADAKQIQNDTEKIKNQTSEIEHRKKTEELTYQVIDKFFANLKDVAQSPVEKSELVVRLLYVIAETNLSPTAKAQDWQRVLPLRMALLIRNDELLASMDSEFNYKQFWIPIAANSADEKERHTAVKALCHICRNLAAKGKWNAVDDSFREALELCSSSGGQSEEVRNALLDLSRAAGMIGDKMTADNGVDEKNPPPAVVNLKKRFADLTVRAQSSQAAVATATSKKIEQVTGNVGAAEKVTTLEQEKKKTIDVLNQAILEVPKAEETAPNLPQLVENLKSSDKTKRGEARASLAALGPQTFKPILLQVREEANQSGSARDFLREGVATALFLTKNTLRLDDDEARTVAGFLFDENAETRSSAAEFMMALNDDETIRRSYAALKEIVDRNLEQNTGPPQSAADRAVFNAVTIMGTWVRVVPTAVRNSKKDGPFVKEVETQLGDYKKKMTQNSVRWNKSLARINELLAKGKPRQSVAYSSGGGS